MSADLFILGVMACGGMLYAVLGGADFGGGVWELTAARRASVEERTLIRRAIGPVWEANHVWLIFVIVVLWSAFPPAFAGLTQALWVPLFLALAGIVFRGVAFAFRGHVAGHTRQEALWGRVFALASTAAPFFLGAAVGAVASGLEVDASGTFSGDILTGWLSPMAVFGAFFAVAVCAFLASAYLTREAAAAGDVALTDRWRRRALLTGALVGVLATGGIALVTVDAPEVWDGMRERAWPLIIVMVTSNLLSLWGLWRRRWNLAAVGAAGTVAAIMWGWALAQYPLLVPSQLTVDAAKAPDTVLTIMAWGVVAGLVLLVPALVLLFSLFKTQRSLEEAER